MKNIIITISREYGSGGRDVGRILAGELGLPIFDKEIIHMAMEKSGMSEDFVAKHGESVPSKFRQNLQRLSLNVPNIRIPSGYNSAVAMSRTAGASNNNQSNADKLFFAQSSVIKEIAGMGGCVIVGRCANYILKEHPNLLSVFIRGNLDDRMNRAVETYGMTEKDAAREVVKIDKHRANYYKFYTDKVWGAVDNYDLVINTSYTDICGAVGVIKAMVGVKRKS